MPLNATCLHTALQTRVQVQTLESTIHARYSGVLGSLFTIYAEEGLAGWYRGFTPAVCSVAVFWTVYFPCYDYAKIKLMEASGLPASSSLIHMTAAGASGLLTDVITNPFWVVRTRLATQTLRVPEPAGPGNITTSSGGDGSLTRNFLAA